jgi:hypothetical protein
MQGKNGSIRPVSVVHRECDSEEFDRSLVEEGFATVVEEEGEEDENKEFPDSTHMMGSLPVSQYSLQSGYDKIVISAKETRRLFVEAVAMSDAGQVTRESFVQVVYGTKHCFSRNI